MQVDERASPDITRGHARAAAATLLRRYSEDSVYGSTSFGALEDESDPISSVCFLLQLAARLEEDGNHAESLRCSESALVVRQVHRLTVQDVRDWVSAHPNDLSPSAKEKLAFVLSSDVAQAKELVLRCNALAVQQFNACHFDVSGYYLTKALHFTSKHGDPVLGTLSRAALTSVDGSEAAKEEDAADVLSGSETTALGNVCFYGDDEERRRLQAATCNNAGCMERRRGRLEVSLLYLREAASIEVQLDPTGQSSASTYLNLCTVLNEMHRYAEAVVTAERACNALQLAIPEQSDEEDVAKLAMMLAVGQYNLGVSLERRGQRGDQVAAERAYQQCLATSQQYLVDQASASVEAAVEAIRRMGNYREASIVRRSVRAPEVASHDSHGNDAAAPTVRVPTPPTAAATTAHNTGSSHNSSVVAPFSWVPTDVASSGAPMQPKARHYLPQLPLRGTPPASSAAANASTAAAADGKDATVPSAHGAVAPPAAPTTSSTADARRNSSSLSATRASQGGVSAYSSTPPPLLAATQNALFRPNPTVGSGHGAMARPAALPPRHPPTLAPLPTALNPLTATVGGVPSSAPTVPASQRFAQTMPAASPMRVPNTASSSSTGRRHQGLPNVGPRLSAAAVRTASTAFAASTTSTNPFGRRTFGSAAAPASGSSRGTAAASDSTAREATASSAPRGPASALGRASLARSVSGSGAGGRTAAGAPVSQAKRLEARLRRENRQRKEKEVAQHDASVAEALHHQMVQGMKHEELRRCHKAAVVIQAVWRGVLARTLLSTMMSATIVLQRAVRRFLVVRREMHRRQAAEQAQQRALQAQRERAAAGVLQTRVRQFLNRCRIVRQFRASRMRNFYAARTIQRAYRAHRVRLAEHIAAIAEAHRYEDLQREFARRVAAKRIQRAYRAYQSRRVEVLVHQNRQRRHQAAAAIQAVVRGVLTRSWFRYYKAYRRDQEVRSAVNQRRLILIQASCRATLSTQLVRQRRLDQLTVQRHRQLDAAATHIQCLWRCHVARIRFARLEAERARLDRRAAFIQRWYRMCHERRAFLQYREGVRRLRAALHIQRWLREQRQQAKEREFAAYHAEQLRQVRLKQQREHAVRVAQACLLARQSQGMVAGMRRDFLKREWCALLWQRVGRAYAARCDVGWTLVAAHAVAKKERLRAEHTAAVLVLQRAWRCAAAKDRVEQLRRERAAGHVIANNYKIHLAKKELRALREQRDARQRDRAARTIQHAVRTFQRQRRVNETRTYYEDRHRRQMHTLRRQEAATMIQSVWRGHATRCAVAEERAALRTLGVYATRIQRAWRRSRAQKQRLHETQVRTAENQYYHREALVIQCFWRKMRAAEKVAQLREAHKGRVRAALVLQCWWRQMLAQRVALQKYLLRREEDELALFYAIKWERACTVVNAFLRCRLSELHVREERRLSMLAQLHYEGRVRFTLRADAAVKIQAAYRGHYERVYVRGLRREKAEADRKAAEEAARERRAAVCIQCAWRSYCARRERRRLHDEKVHAILASQEDYLATANPEEIVRELFWAEAAVAKRQFTQERLQRQQARQVAATKIQRAFRSVTSTRAVKDVQEYRAQDKAARAIQAHWRAFKIKSTARDHQQRVLAAIIIQRYVRGWLVRKDWSPWRQAMARERRHSVQVQDAYDHAATVLQALWRGIMARTYTDGLRQSRQEEKDAAAREEAAMLIQEAFRAHLHEKRARTI